MCNERKQPVWKQVLEWVAIIAIMTMLGVELFEVREEIYYAEEWHEYVERVDRKLDKILEAQDESSVN